MGCPFKSLPGSLCALFSQVPNYARRSQRPLCCPASPCLPALSGSLQSVLCCCSSPPHWPARSRSFSPVTERTLSLTACPLFSLQPLFAASVGRSVLSSSFLILSLSFLLVWFPPSYLYFFFCTEFQRLVGFLCLSVVLRVFTGAFTRCLLLEWSTSSGCSCVYFQFLLFVLWYFLASFSFHINAYFLSMIVQDLFLIFVYLILLFALFYLVLAV